MTVSNAAPFTPVVRIFPGGNPVDADTWGVGYDISQYVLYPSAEGGQAIQYRAGRPDEATRVDAGQMDLTLNNRDGRFSTKNPEGPYYPLLRRGTPITLSMVSGEDDFGRTEATGWGTSSGGGVWTLSGSASNWSVGSGVGSRIHPTAGVIGTALLGGADAANVRGHFTASTPSAVTGASLIAGVILRYVSASEFYYLTIEFNTDSTVSTKIWKRGDVELGGLHPVPSLTYAPGDRFTCWFEADGSELRVKVGPAADPEPADWHATASDSSVQGAGVGLTFNRLGSNTNVNARMDFDDLVVEAVEFTGTVTKWPLRWNKRSTNSWAPIQAAGILARLKQGTPALKSPLARQLPAYNPTGYWTLEDASDATTFGSSVTGVPAAAKSGATVTPASDTSLPGASQSPTFANATASIRGITPLRQTGTGFSFMFLVKLDALPAAKTRMVTIGGSGRIVTWNIYIDQTNALTTEGIESDGTVTVNTSNALGSLDTTDWVAYQLETETDSGTLEWATLIHGVGSDSFGAQSGSFATSAAARAWSWQLGGGGSDLNGAAWAHVWVGENTLPFVNESFRLVSDGYRGELASDRIARLCAEESIPVVVEAGTSEALGPQRTGNVVDVLYSAADADYGILYEAGNGLGYRPRAARYSRDVSFAVSVAAGEIDEPPEGEDDTQRVSNDWTVSRDDGSYAQEYDQDHIDAEGRWPDTASINVETDDVLTDHAAWRVFLGTRDDLRWPALTFNFARSPSLIPTWRAAPYGARVQVTTGLDQVIGSDPDVYVEGYAATLWPHGWTVEMACSSALPWDVPALDGAAFRVDAGDCVLAEALDTIETGIDVTTGDGFPWRETAELVGAVLEVGGETMTVVSVSGAGASQTITVTRSTNGVVKAHAVGDAVGLADPTYLAL